MKGHVFAIFIGDNTGSKMQSVPYAPLISGGRNLIIWLLVIKTVTAMDKSATNKIRKELLCMKTELEELEDASRDSSATVELDQSRVGRLSRMDALQSQEMALETKRRRDLMLKKIDGALLRIDNGDFGYCFVCGEAIEPGRLAADPTNTRCLACADK